MPEDVDEYGIPIKKRNQPEVDEFGIAIKKKSGLDGYYLRSKQTNKSFSSDQSGGATPSTVKPIQKIQEYNKSFEEATGHKDLSLGSDLPQITKQRDQQQYLKNRNIEEYEIKPVLNGVATGTIQPEQLSKLYNQPHGKKIVSEIINEQVPEVGSAALESDVFGNEKKWDAIATAIQQKNRTQGIEQQNQYEQNLDADLANKIFNYKAGKNLGSAETRHGGGVDETPLGDIDNFNDPAQLRTALEKLQNADYIIGTDGKKDIEGKKALINSIQEKMLLLKAKEPLPDEINNFIPQINKAVDNMKTVGWRKSASPEQQQQYAELDKKYIQQGLNYLKDENPAQYKNIMRSIGGAEAIADTDYEMLVGIGKKINGQQQFQSGELVKDDNRDFSTYQTRRADLSAQLSEKLKSMGYKNQGKIPDKAIVKASLELGVDPNSEEGRAIRLDEANGGYGIVKGGGLTAFFRGIASPIKSVQQTFDSGDPVSTYLNSKRFDYGDQKIPDKEGNVSDVLPSERDAFGSWSNFFNKGAEGLGQVITQVAGARGLGKIIEAPYALAAAKYAPRAALTAEQSANIAAYGGGGVSTLAQTWGQSYIDFLNKTGNPDKSALMATIDALGQSALEVGVMPDVKIAESMEAGLKSSRQNLAKNIIGVIDKGEGKEAMKPFIKTFVEETAQTLGKEVGIEETSQNLWNYMTENLFSPKTGKDRNISEETAQVLKEAGTQMLLPAILGGFGDAKNKASEKFSKDALHTGAINFDKYKEYLTTSLLSGTVNQQDYDKALGILTTHKNSIDNAPKRDANGEVISANRQLEYAFQNTISETNQQLAAQQPDAIQKEPFVKKVENADAIKRKIFYGEEGKGVPKEEEVKPDPKVEEENHLDEVASQALNKVASVIGEGENQITISDDAALSQAVNTYGKDVVAKAIEQSKAKELAENQAELAAIENPNEGDQEVFADMANDIIKKHDDAIAKLSEQKTTVDEAKPATPKEESVSVPEEKKPIPKAKKDMSRMNEARKVYEDIGEVGQPSDARGLALEYLAGGGKVHENSIDEVAGTVKKASLNTGKKEKASSEVKARGYASKDGKTIDEIAHSIWDNLPAELKSEVNTQNLKNELNDVVKNHNTRLSAATEFRDRYVVSDIKSNLTDTDLKEMNDDLISKRVAIVDQLPENQQTDLLKLLEKYQDKYGNVDWEKLESDSNGFDPEILSLPAETQNALDAIIQKNISEGQGELGNTANKDGAIQKESGEKTVDETPKQNTESDQPVTTEEKSSPNGESKKDSSPTEKIGDEVRKLAEKVRAGKISKLGGFKSLSDKKEFEDKYTEHMNNELGGKPPTSNTSTTEKSDDGKLNDKGILSHLHKAKNIPEAARKGFEEEGLKYQTKNQQEAHDVAKAYIKEVGIDAAVSAAEAMKFDGDVNSMIFAETLNQLKEQEDAAKTPEEKLEAAKKFAEVGITYDKMARYGGRFNAAINYFYKKSPLGIVMMENAKRQEDFKQWSKPNNQSWKEFYDEMIKEPEFDAIIQEQIKEGLKKERADSRSKRIEKVRDVFKSAKAKFNKEGGGTYSTFIPPHIITAVLETMELAYEAGEAVGKIIQEAIDSISDKLETTTWDIDKFRKEWSDKLKDGSSAEDLYKERLKKQIAELDQQIANRKRSPKKEKEEKEYDDETKALIEERDKKRLILDQIVAPQDRLDRYKSAIKRQIEELNKQIADKKRKAKPEKAKLDNEAEELTKQRDTLNKELERVAPLKETDEYKFRELEKFRKRLKGLTEKQKNELVQKAFKQIIENGGLKFDDFRKMIAQVTGRGDLTDAEAQQMKDLVAKTNAVEAAAEKVRTERTEESFVKLREAEIEAGRASKELNELFHNKPDIVKRLTSIMQLSTLGIPALVNNPIYNLWNQATLRFPIGVINTTIDKAMSSISKLFGKEYDREYNISAGQAEFWRKLGLGTKEAISQLGTGLSRMDYTQKEVAGQQIRPFRSLRDLYNHATGNKPLSHSQWWDKALQGTVGIPAEAVARVLNLGDKPQRFAAEGAQAAAFAKTLGLQGMDYKLFIEFPREESYRAYKALGLSDEVAGQKADANAEAIIKEGKRSTFQQDNLLNDAITRAAGVLGGKDSGTSQLAKSLVISPYIKIPSNAFWSYYNLINPEVAILQAMTHAGISQNFKKKGDLTKSKLQSREARYWLAHAIVGMGMRAVVIALVKAGIFIPSWDKDDSKKESDANSLFDDPGYLNIGDIKISNRWFAQWGMMGNAVARKYREATPEQREAQDDFWNTVLGGMEIDALKEMESGVFANSSSLLQSIGSGDFSRYGVNTLNMLYNIIQPASVAQINRAALDNVPTSKGDGFLDTLNKSIAQRSTLYRRLFGVQLDYKRDIWGQPMPKGGNILSRMFGVTKADPQVFGRPIYNDFMRTSDSGFLPPAVLPVLNGQKLNSQQAIRLQEYIGSERKRLAEPYVSDMSQIIGFNKKYSELKKDEDKKFVLQYIYETGRSKGIEKFYKDYPELRPKDQPVDYESEIERSLFKTLLPYEK